MKKFLAPLVLFGLIAPVVLPVPVLAASAVWEPPAISPAAKPSFDCKKAEAAVEIVICSDVKLAALDRHLSQLYTAARAALPKPEKDALIETQRKWIDDRKPEILTGQYLDRIVALQALLTQGNVIREIAKTDPWATPTKDAGWRDRMMLGECSNYTGANDGTHYGASPSDSDSRYRVFLIGGMRYVFLNATFRAAEAGPPAEAIDGEAPEPIYDSFSCTEVLAEIAPGAGFFSAHDADGFKYGWSGIHNIVDLLKGYVPDKVPTDTNTDYDSPRIVKKPINGFAIHVHQMLKSDDITLKEENGNTRHFRWDNGTQWYVEVR